MTAELNSQNVPADATSPSRTEQLVEVAVFLFLIVPSMIISLFAVKQGSLSFVLVAFSVMAQDLALVSLILFFLWHNGEPFKRIGWTFANFWRELALGVVLFFPLFFAAGILESVLQSLGLSAPSTPLPSFLTAQGYAQFVLAFVLVIVVAVAEETIFRGYLILRFNNLIRNEALAVILSAAVFSLGHGYEGSAGIATVGLLGVALAVVYVWRKSLIAPITMHFLLDFLSIVLLPILGAT